MKLNWKAIGIGVVAAIIISFIPLINFLATILGGFVAAWYGKSKDMKDGAITGGAAGAISWLIVGVAVFFLATAVGSLFGGLGSLVGGTLGAIAVVLMLIMGFVLGAIGGLIGAAIAKKK